jgi:2-dehydropantoate 2-reductase
VIEVTRGAWTGGSMTWIGGPGAEAVAPALRGAGMAIEVREDIDALVWNKVAMAGAMSPVASLVRLPNGLVLGTRETRELLEQMTREIVAVANAKGIALDADEAIARNVAVYETSLDHRPSMLDDVLAGRRTEIDSLCGAVVREGQGLGVPVPVSATLWRLIRAIEQRYEDAVA